MALLTKHASASVDASTTMFAEQLSGLVAGEDIAILDACYVKSDGKVWRSNGTADNAAAKFDGIAAQAASAGQGVTLFGRGTRARYSNGGLTPAALYYVAATAGRLDTAATTGGLVPIAKAISANDIRIVNLVP
jgi:hypothetical protein